MEVGGQAMFFATREGAELRKLAEVEEEIRNFVREREDSASESQAVADKLAVLIGRVAGNSVREIDGLTAGLYALRGELLGEGERVQRDIVEYAMLSQTAMQSTKIMAERLAHWKALAVAATESESPNLGPITPADNPAA
jgi:hypothetical protein